MERVVFLTVLHRLFDPGSDRAAGGVVTGVETALKYKELWMVEAVFRCLKSVLETRPIYHKRDDTIRGHVFCSFLALVLLKELQARLEDRGWYCEWERLKNDLEALEEFTVASAGSVRGQKQADRNSLGGSAPEPSAFPPPESEGGPGTQEDLTLITTPHQETWSRDGRESENLIGATGGGAVQ